MLLSAFLLALPLASALPSITRTGRYLYDESGTRFMIKGIAYQEAGEVAADSEANQANGGFPEPSSFVDPLAQGDACKRDVPYLQQLGVNTIRVYSVNASLNHDTCMNLLEDAGIYTIIDLSLPLNGSINRADPAWTTNLLDLYATTALSFSKYSNILAFNIGNEIVTGDSNSNTAPFIKAAARDTKAYLRSIGSSALVGYSATDGENEARVPLSEYLSCSSDEESIDLYGLNNYRWCGDETYSSSEWEQVTEGYADLTIPAYYSEYGCNAQRPRSWSEVPTLYSLNASTAVWSGGVAFSYFPNSQDYGIITLSSDNTTVTTSTEFDNLAAQLKNVTVATTPSKSSVSNAAAPACPSGVAGFAASTTFPPTPDQDVCDCLETSAFPCVNTQTLPMAVGELIDYGCTLLPQDDTTATCDDIGANGTSGTYGRLSFCSPQVKLSYIFSAHYVAQDFNVQACDFSGNGTVSSSAPKSAQAASDAATSCLAKVPAGGVFTPSAAGMPAASPTGGASSAGGSSAASASASSGGGTSAGWLIVDRSGVVGWAFALVGVVVGAVTLF